MTGQLAIIVWLGWVIGQVACFIEALRRYSIGNTGSWRHMFSSPAWSSPGGNLFWVVVFTVLSMTTAWMLWRLGREHRSLIPG